MSKKLTKISSTSERGAHIINAYEASHMKTLREAYPSHYSVKKEEAFKYCEDLMHELGGSDMRITGSCTNFFSVAFKYTDKETGEKRLAYITHANDYYVPYEYSTLTYEDFEKRWNENVSENIKAHTAKALAGHTVTSMEEAEFILKSAEAFSIMEALTGGAK